MALPCFWPNCKNKTADGFYGCGNHWSVLPEKLKKEIRENYQLHEEFSEKPSEKAVKSLAKAKYWAKKNEKNYCTKCGHTSLWHKPKACYGFECECKGFAFIPKNSEGV